MHNDTWKCHLHKKNNMTFDTNLILTAGLSAVAGIVWLVRLEGKISTEMELRKALQDRLDGFERRISDTLDRIEQKLDAKQDK